MSKRIIPGHFGTGCIALLVLGGCWLAITCGCGQHGVTREKPAPKTEEVNSAPESGLKP